jgi:hypothetical protein
MRHLLRVAFLFCLLATGLITGVTVAAPRLPDRAGCLVVRDDNAANEIVIDAATGFLAPPVLDNANFATVFNTRDYVLSPDGHSVLTLVSDNNTFRLYIGWRNSQHPRILDTGTSSTLPVWSPDGQAIAFARMGEHNTYTILGAEGTEQVSVPIETPYDLSPYSPLNIVWSPDSLYTAFISSDGTMRSMLLNAHTGQTIPLDDGQILAAEWAPHGHIFVMLTRPENSEAQGRVVWIDAEHGGIKRMDFSTILMLADSGTLTGQFQWSSDGKLFAIHTNDDNAPGIDVFDVQGNLQITIPDRYGQLLGWVSGTHQVFYRADVPDHTTQAIHRLNLDTGQNDLVQDNIIDYLDTASTFLDQVYLEAVTEPDNTVSIILIDLLDGKLTSLVSGLAPAPDLEIKAASDSAQVMVAGLSASSATLRVLLLDVKTRQARTLDLPFNKGAVDHMTGWWIKGERLMLSVDTSPTSTLLYLINTQEGTWHRIGDTTFLDAVSVNTTGNFLLQTSGNEDSVYHYTLYDDDGALLNSTDSPTGYQDAAISSTHQVLFWRRGGHANSGDSYSDDLFRPTWNQPWTFKAHRLLSDPVWSIDGSQFAILLDGDSSNPLLDQYLSIYTADGTPYRTVHLIGHDYRSLAWTNCH